MIFEFENNILFLQSPDFRIRQDFNTETGKPFQNIEEAKQWATKYFGEEQIFIDEKIDITDFDFFNRINTLQVEENVENDEYKINLQIYQFENNEIIWEKDLSLEEMKNFDTNQLELPKGKYYYSIPQLKIFFEKNNSSFVIE